MAYVWRVSRCIIVLEGKGLDRPMGQEVRQASVLVTVDRGLDVAFELEATVKIAFVGRSKPKDKVRDWAMFSMTRFENYGTGQGQDGAELALEWALTTPGIRAVDLVNAFTGDPLVDHGRLLLLARHHSSEITLQVLESRHRWMAIDAEYTLNGKAGELFSLLPVSEDPVELTLKNGDETVNFKDLGRGNTVLVDRKMSKDVANIRVQQGMVLARFPRV